MWRSMVDIQSTAAEIRRGKKRKKKPQDKNIMVCPITQGDHNQLTIITNTTCPFVIIIKVGWHPSADCQVQLSDNTKPRLHTVVKNNSVIYLQYDDQV